MRKIAFLNFDITTKDDCVQILPLGDFEANGKLFRVTAEDAARLSSELSSRQRATVIDYEHQSFLSKHNGQPAPAAGWFKKTFVENGLFAADIEWTDPAVQYIKNKEYRYISPAVQFESDGGINVIRKVLNASLTNNPAIDGMKELFNMEHNDENVEFAAATTKIENLELLLATATAKTNDLCVELATAVTKLNDLSVELANSTAKIAKFAAENMVLKGQLIGKVNKAEIEALMNVGIKDLGLLQGVLDARPESDMAMMHMQTDNLDINTKKQDDVMVKLAQSRRDSNKEKAHGLN